MHVSVCACAGGVCVCVQCVRLQGVHMCVQGVYVCGVCVRVQGVRACAGMGVCVRGCT